MKKLSKFLFVILAIVMLLSVMPMVFAAGNAPELEEDVFDDLVEIASGKCGENLTWSLSVDGVLTISGSGAMKDYSSSTGPWYSNRSSIKEVILPEELTNVGDRAFMGCSNLTTITLPDGLTSIGNSAFYDCDSLTEISIPKGVTTIGDSAFYSCNGLTSITLLKGLITIGDWVFSYCSNLITITLPEGITTIGDHAFYHCDSLTTIALPESLTTIGNSAFYDCDSLTEISIPKGVTTIGDSAFRDCDSLTEISIPEGVTSIGSYAFTWCYKLTSITIPISINKICSYAFYKCSKLQNVYYGSTEADWAKIEIGDYNEPLSNARLHFLNIPDYQLLSLRILKDSDGEELASIPTSTFYAEAKVKKLQEADPVLIMLVSYTKEGKMLSANYLRAEVPSGSTFSQGCYINNTDGKVGEVKAFLLSSLGNPEPLCEAISVK